jgi:hypothetical protein
MQMQGRRILGTLGFASPFTATISGSRGESVILKPAKTQRRKALLWATTIVFPWSCFF